MRKIGIPIKKSHPLQPVKIPAYDYLMPDYMPNLWCCKNDKWVTVYRSDSGHFEVMRAAMGDPNCFSFEEKIPTEEQTKKKIVINTPLATRFPIVLDLIKAKFEVWVWTQAEGLVLCDHIGIKLDDIFPMKRNTLLNEFKESQTQVFILDHFKLQKLQRQAIAAQKRVSIGDADNSLSMIYQTEMASDRKEEYYSNELSFRQAVKRENEQEDLEALIGRSELTLSDLLLVDRQKRDAFIHSLEVDSNDCALCIDIEIGTREVAEAIIRFYEIRQLPFVLIVPASDVFNSYLDFFNSFPAWVSKVDEIRFMNASNSDLCETDIIYCLNKFGSIQRLTTFITLGSRFRDFLQSPAAFNFTRSLISFIAPQHDAWLTDLNVTFPKLTSLYLADFEADADVENVQTLLEHTPNLTWLRVERFNNSERFVLPLLMKLERLTLLSLIKASLLATLKDRTPKLTYLCLDEVCTSEPPPLFEELPTKLTVVKYLAINYGDDEDNEKTINHDSLIPLIIKNSDTLEKLVFFFHSDENRCHLEQIEEFLPVSFVKLRELTLKDGQKDDNTLALFFPDGHAPPCLERFDSEMGWWMNADLSRFRAPSIQSHLTKLTDWRLMTYNFCKYDSKILENLFFLQRLILIVEFADNVNDGILDWNESDTQTLTHIKLPNLTQLTVIYKMGEGTEHLLKLNSGIANALITAVSTQLTALTFGQARADLSTDLIELEGSIKFNNLHSLSIALPFNIENPDSLLRRCPVSLQFLAIELHQNSVNQFSQALQPLQSLTDLHIYITDTEDNVALDLFSGIRELPVLHQLSIMVEEGSLSIMDMPRMPELTELTLCQITMTSQSLISTMNSTQTLRHLRLDHVIVTGDSNKMLQPQPLLFLSLTDSCLPQTFITLIKAERSRLQWLNLTNLVVSEMTILQSNANVWRLIDEKEMETVAFPQLRLKKTDSSFDIGEMNPATIVLKEKSEYQNSHLLPKEVHEVEDELRINELSLNTSDLSIKNSIQVTQIQRIFLEMPYIAERADILNSTRLDRMRCLSGSKWNDRSKLVFFQEALQQDFSCHIMLSEQMTSEKNVYSLIESMEKNNPQENVLLSLAVINCVLQQGKFFQLPGRGISDLLTAISFNGRTIKNEDLFFIRGNKGFFYVSIKNDPNLPVKQAGRLSYVLQSLWHEIQPVTEDITKKFLCKLIKTPSEDVHLNWRLEEIFPQINKLSARFRAHDGEPLTDEEYELPESQLLETVIRTGRGSCEDRAQAGVNYIRRMLRVSKITSEDVEISIINNQIHTYPEIKIFYTVDNQRQWIILHLEWGGIQFPREMTIIDTPKLKKPLVIFNNHDTNDIPLFSERKLVCQQEQNVIEYAAKRLTVKLGDSSPTLLIFDEAMVIAYFALLILSIAQRQHIPVFYARTLNELQCVTKGLIRTQSDSDILEYKQDCETTLSEFLRHANKNSDKNYFLMINWEALVEKDSSARVTFNRMIDTKNPKIDSIEKPDNVRIISLDNYQAKFDRSFLRRHSDPEEFPFNIKTIQEVLETEFNLLPLDQKKIEPTILKTVSSDEILELGGSTEHWRSLLLGNPYLDHNSGQFKLQSSPWVRLLKGDGDEKSNFTLLSNPPLEDPDFILFMMRTQIEGVHSFGHFYPPAYFTRFRWSDQVVQHWEELLTNVVEFYETPPSDDSFLPLSPTFCKAFIQRVVIGERERERVRTQPGWLEQFSGETATIYLTEAISCLAWFELLSAAKKYQVSLRVHAQIQDLPNEIRSHFKARVSTTKILSDPSGNFNLNDDFLMDASHFKNLFPGDRCHCHIVAPEQLDRIVEQYKQQWAISDETKNYSIIDGQDLKLSDLCYVFDMQGIEANAVYVKRRYTHFWQALVEGQTILLKGVLSTEVCRWLEDVCRYQQRGLWNGSDWVDWFAADKNQARCLHIVTTSREGFSSTFIANGLSKPLFTDVDMVNTQSMKVESETVLKISASIFNNSNVTLFQKGERIASNEPRTSVKHIRLSKDQFIDSIHNQAKTAFFLHLEGLVSLGSNSIPECLIKDSSTSVFLASQIQAWAVEKPESGVLIFLYLNQIPTGRFKTLGEEQEQFCYQGEFFQLSPQHRVIIHSEKSLLFPSWLSKKVRTISLTSLDIENILTHYLIPLVTKPNYQDFKTIVNEFCPEEFSIENKKEEINHFFRSFSQISILEKPFSQAIVHERVLQRILCSYLARRNSQDTLLFFADQLAQGILTAEDYADFQIACQKIFPQAYQPNIFSSEHKRRSKALVNEQQRLQKQRFSETFVFVDECTEALIALESALHLCQWQRMHPEKKVFKPALMITGDTSVGKSSLVRNYLHNQEYQEIDYRKLLSVERGLEDSKRFCLIPANLDQETKKKILTKAFHDGVVCVWDEFEVRGLEDFLYDLLNGYDVDGQPARKGGFALICTRNPRGYGNDRQPLPQSLQRFFWDCDYPFYSKSSIEKILNLHDHLPTNELGKIVDAFIAQSKERMAFGDPPVAFSKLLSVVNELLKKEIEVVTPSSLMEIDHTMTYQSNASSSNHQDGISSSPPEKEKNYAHAKFSLINTWTVIDEEWMRHPNYLEEILEQQQYFSAYGYH